MKCGDKKQYSKLKVQKKKLTARMRVYRQQINDPSTRNTLCSEHFDRCAKGDYKVFPFFKLKTDYTAMMLVKENYFHKVFPQS